MTKAFRAFSEYPMETDADQCPDKGFQLTFANGLTASVMFGRGNYCEVRYAERPIGGSDSAEIAVWNAKGDYLFHDGSAQYDEETDSYPIPQSDTGWKSADQIAAALVLIASFPSDICKLDAIKRLHEIF